MKEFFIKYLPLNEILKVGDNFIKKYRQEGEGVDTVKTEEQAKALNELNSREPWNARPKAKLFLCTGNVKVGDKTFPFWEGGIKSAKEGRLVWRTEDFMTGWPDDPHIILDLNHSTYEPYQIRTSHGYGWGAGPTWPGSYVKVIQQVPDDITHLNDGDELTTKQVEEIFGIK